MPQIKTVFTTIVLVLGVLIPLNLDLEVFKHLILFLYLLKDKETSDLAYMVHSYAIYYTFSCFIHVLKFLPVLSMFP